MLEVKNVSAAYGRIEAIKDISLTVNQGEIVVIVGRNGAGKTTTLKAISGLLRPRQGQILYNGQDITGMTPHSQSPGWGLNMVPEGRQIFADQSVGRQSESGPQLTPPQRQLKPRGKARILLSTFPPPQRTPQTAGRHAIGR